MTVSAFPHARLPGAARRLAPKALAAAALLGGTLACTVVPAHDWISPAPRALPVRAIAQDRAAPGPWSGLIWPGVASGAPAQPAASDCHRAPVPFDLAGPPGFERQAAAPARLALGRASGREAAEAPSLADRADRAERAVAAAAAPPAAAAQPMPAPPRARPADEPVTAGVVDDNADFGEYLSYRKRWPQVQRRELDLGARVLLDVRDGRGRPVPDARVRVFAGEREMPLWARTDAGGRAWLMPQPDAVAARYEVEVSKGRAQTRVLWQRGQKDVLQARLDGAPSDRARLDVVFLVDATGSMGDEIDKLKRSMRAVADEVARLPSRPDLCFGLVAYRDRGDAFFVRGADFSNDLGAFQGVLAQLQAGGGGDYPEALNEALHTAVHRLSWRDEGTARVVLLLADAPPHLDYGVPQYDQDLRAAQARGIKVFGVGASGLDAQGEYIFRQMAQFTGGRFVFLTYAQADNPASGPGRETGHDVRNYSVETLDKLLVRLLAEEMQRWPALEP